MAVAYPEQKFQDWFTQQWAILFGRRINPKDYPWLLGPFGGLHGIGENFINQLAGEEGLIVQRNEEPKGLITSIQMLELDDTELSRLSFAVIDFYEQTSIYQLYLNVRWNPFFKPLGILVNRLFSNRINQLNMPTDNTQNPESLSSEIISLIDPLTGEVKYTIWLRTNTTNNRVMYAGIYGLCTLPSGKTCIKVVFPLPKGNATVILTPRVGRRGELILDSSGKKFGDAGFYFLLSDAKGRYWSHFISSFRDQFIISTENNFVTAKQTLSLWKLKVLKCTYRISKINENTEYARNVTR